MGDVLEIRVIEKIDFDDFEECIAKDYRHYVKLKSREEPYEVSAFTYREVLKWIAEVNAATKELAPCHVCGQVPEIDDWYGKYAVKHKCPDSSGVDIGTRYFVMKMYAIKAWNEWNRRAS